MNWKGLRWTWKDSDELERTQLNLKGLWWTWKDSDELEVTSLNLKELTFKGFNVIARTCTLNRARKTSSIDISSMLYQHLISISVYCQQQTVNKKHKASKPANNRQTDGQTDSNYKLDIRLLFTWTSFYGLTLYCWRSIRVRTLLWRWK